MFFALRPHHSSPCVRACCRAALAPAKPNPHGVCRQFHIRLVIYRTSSESAIEPCTEHSNKHTLPDHRVLSLFGILTWCSAAGSNPCLKILVNFDTSAFFNFGFATKPRGSSSFLSSAVVVANEYEMMGVWTQQPALISD